MVKAASCVRRGGGAGPQGRNRGSGIGDDSDRATAIDGTAAMGGGTFNAPAAIRRCAYDNKPVGASRGSVQAGRLVGPIPVCRELAKALRAPVVSGQARANPDPK